ncbi:MAG: helix-turn-helix transcriptional regulator [Clostridia bacterium]|nr:helix-turn-helix transcriptional regulator [Clostridia bacterium]
MTDYPKYCVQRVIEIDALCSIHYFEFDDKFVDCPEAHEAWEMVYIDRGACTVIAGENSLRLEQGELYFHPPYEQHLLQTLPGICPNVFIVSFCSASPAMARLADRRIEASLGVRQQIAAILHEAQHTFAMPFNDPQARGFRLKAGDRLWGGEQSVLLRLELLLLELARQTAPDAQPPRMVHGKEIITDPFCLEVIAYMEQRLYEKISLDALSRAMSFSRSYISRRFAEVCGCSVIDYFNWMKVNEAKRLIRETGMNFTEIAEELLFANSHYFSTVFKQHTGMTPSQYRRSVRTHEG